jgi:hypothetical protein
VYGLFHVPDAAMPRDAAGQLMSPWNLVQSVLAEEVTTENFQNLKFVFLQIQINVLRMIDIFFLARVCIVILNCAQKKYIFKRQSQENLRNLKKFENKKIASHEISCQLLNQKGNLRDMRIF